jgi:hypothetical protein
VHRRVRNVQFGALFDRIDQPVNAPSQIR